MLEDAVKSATSEEEFKKNIGRLQFVGQRLLGIMIFNSCYGSGDDPKNVLKLISLGIERELESIIEASKAGPENLTSVQTNHQSKKKNEH